MLIKTTSTTTSSTMAAATTTFPQTTTVLASTKSPPASAPTTRARSAATCGVVGVGINQALFFKSATTHFGAIEPKETKNLTASHHKKRKSQPNIRFHVSRPHGNELRKQPVNVALTVVGGHPAQLAQICWQVMLDIFFPDGSGYSCGGTIIGPKTILTAAHCMFDETNNKANASGVFVTVGAMSSAASPGQHPATGCSETYAVSKLRTHLAYNADLHNNDIAVLTLARPIDFASKSCACRICLEDVTPKVGETCIASGTGTEFSDDPDQDRPMKYVAVTVLENIEANCPFSEDSNGLLTNADLLVCAGNVVGEDTCQGDSGGPLVCLDETGRFYSAGITSFGAGCGTGMGGQYTKTKSYLTWILANAAPEDML